MARFSLLFRQAAAVGMLLAVCGVARAAGELKLQTEPELLKTLREGSAAEKALACKQLAIVGNAECIPELAKLLSDEQLSSWSRIALEAIPDTACDTVLIDGAKTLRGKLLVGVINSLGVRRSSAAVDVLTVKLKGDDADAIAAAGVALGKIGGDKATSALRESLASSNRDARNAAAEGYILCAERLNASGKKNDAASLYNRVRTADVSKQHLLEATRGEIVAKGNDGAALLVEQLKSHDRKRFNLGLKVSRELAGQKVTDALAAELKDAPAERAALIITALGDRATDKLPAAVVDAAQHGEKPIKLAAIEVFGRVGQGAMVPALLEIAAGDDTELAAAAKTALDKMPGTQADSDLVHRLSSTHGKSLDVLIHVIGQRRIDAVKDLIEIYHGSDESARNAALLALGSTIEPQDLPLLIKEVKASQNTQDGDRAEKALQTACVRMPDREATAGQLAEAMGGASTESKARFLRILGAMGGPKALATIAVAVRENDPELRDVGTQVLGQWMTADAAPLLLEIAKSPAQDKFQGRALRGYLRIARQQKMPDAERLGMFREGMEISKRAEDRQLTLDILKRCPSAETVQLASSYMEDKQLRQHAVETAIFIAEKIKDKDPTAAKLAAEKVLKAEPTGKLADRARALTRAQQ
ncbi:MAG TPA: HEAT repeat domain-containing protein [Lacipirellulaceae bacterium]|nr:HEAT repeat domain-containing protein [Lacipirellulaceae bacterium]